MTAGSAAIAQRQENAPVGLEKPRSPGQLGVAADVALTSSSKGPRTKRRGDVWRPQCVPGRRRWTVTGARLERGWVRGDERGESRGVKMAVPCSSFVVERACEWATIVSRQLFSSNVDVKHGDIPCPGRSTIPGRAIPMLSTKTAPSSSIFGAMVRRRAHRNSWRHPCTIDIAIVVI